VGDPDLTIAMLVRRNYKMIEPENEMRGGNGEMVRSNGLKNQQRVEVNRDRSNKESRKERLRRERNVSSNRRGEPLVLT
jgi:hypothetical protein